MGVDGLLLGGSSAGTEQYTSTSRTNSGPTFSGLGERVETRYPQWLQLLISHSQDDAVPEDDVHGAAVHLHERGCVHHLVAHLEQTEHTMASMRV